MRLNDASSPQGSWGARRSFTIQLTALPTRIKKTIASNLMPVLERAKSVALSDYVVEWNGKPLKRIDTALEKAAKRAGVRCTAHILKHSAISYMTEQGFTVGQIAEFTETTSEVVERVYMKVNPKGLIAISEGMNKLIPDTTSSDSAIELSQLT